MNEKIENLEELQVESEEYYCPNCGGPTKFEPSTSTLSCDYCGFKQEINGVSSDLEFALDSDESKLDKEWQQETKVVKCVGCGALNVISIDGITSTCPFCGSNQVLDTDELAGIKPHRVIPFKLDEEIAKNIYITWVKKKFFTPKALKKSKIEVSVSGVYLPMWTFDTETFSSYKGSLGKHYTVTVGSGKNRRTEVRTRWYRISGTINVNFDDLLVNAGKQITQVEIERIAPFSTNDSFEYDKQYLAGFSAEHYQLPLKEGFEKAKVITRPIIERRILSRYIYDVKGQIYITSNFYKTTYKYVLVPTWIGNYTYNNKHYRFIVNGETGKLTGKAPVSALKVTFVILFFIVILFIVYLLMIQ